MLIRPLLPRLTRRGFGAGCLTLAAPAIVRAATIRPPKKLAVPLQLAEFSPVASAPPFFSDRFFTGEPFNATPTGYLQNGSACWKSTNGAAEINYFLGGELEYYQSSASRYSPFDLNGGNLVITASATGAASNPAGHPYSSGLINTYTLPGGTFTGARIDVSARLPSGPGLWPAIWLLPVNNQWPPEIDIVEMLGQDPTMIFCSLHWGPDGSDLPQDKYTQPVSVADTSQGQHRYGIDFDSTVANSLMTFYFDDRIVYQARMPARMYGQTWYLMIELAIGGPGSWGGPPTGATMFPASMLINYVRMYPPGTTLA